MIRTYKHLMSSHANITSIEVDDSVVDDHGRLNVRYNGTGVYATDGWKPMYRSDIDSCLRRHRWQLVPDPWTMLTEGL